jgi:hypothetical protein
MVLGKTSTRSVFQSQPRTARRTTLRDRRHLARSVWIAAPAMLVGTVPSRTEAGVGTLGQHSFAIFQAVRDV